MPVRLADLLTGLSRVADLGFGLEPGTALRSCLVATRLARALTMSGDDVRAAYYVALLHHVGCVGYAHESARLFHDDLTANRAAGRSDSGSVWDLFTTFLPVLTQGRPPLAQARMVFDAVTKGDRWGREFTAGACEVGRDTARRLALPDAVQSGLFHVYDRWRGDSGPAGLNGDDIPVAARLARLAGIATLFHSLGGADLAAEAVRRRAGGMLDPGLVACFDAHAGEAFVDDGDARATVLAAEPGPVALVSDLRDVAVVFGDLADLKSPFLAGHSRAVAALAAGAARELHLPGSVGADLEVSGLLHDVGRVAVSSGIWDKPGPLTRDEWELVRLHPYHSERILAASSELSRFAGLVGRHHERLDGSGYHRGSTAADLSRAARILAAADAFQTMTEVRPHRAALAPDQAAQRLLDAARHGRLDAEAVHAVLASSGRAVPATRTSRRGGLSEREVQVLGLVARGCSNAEIAARLVISRRTAEHHVQHIYTKIGVSGRAAATLFAVEHQLLGHDG